MAIAALSDADLLTGARNGDEAAFTELYVRHHDAARRLAYGYRRCADPDDLVNGAFERVLGALRRGGGPTDSFRAYLFVTLRRLALELAKRQGGDEPMEEVPEPVQAAALVGDPGLDKADREMIAEAFGTLPAAWQTVLWQTAVEGRQPKDVADELDLAPNAAAALAYRARERLRQAYLQAHLRSTPRRGREPHRSRLGGYVRDGLSNRHRAATEMHVEECPSCRDLVAELKDVNRILVRAAIPVFVAAGATFAAKAATGAKAATAATASAGVFDTALTSVRRAGVAAGTVAAAAAAVVVLGITVIPHVGDRGDAAPDVQAAAPDGAGEDTANFANASDADTTATDAAGAAEATTVPGGADGGGPGTGAGADGTGAEGAAGADGGGSPLLELGTDVEAGPIDAEVGASADLGVDVGPDGVTAEADAEVTTDVGLDLEWLRPVLGNGTLQILVPNNGSQPEAGLSLDVQLSADAHATYARCTSPDGGLVGQLLGVVRSLTCTLTTLDAGVSQQADVNVQVTAPGQTATVTLLKDGVAIDAQSIQLPPG